MATITINDKVCEFEGKKTVLAVAIENGVEIPYYCYHPGMSIVASCRICLAEIEQPNPRNDNKPELIPKLMPTCQTFAVDGMIVYSKSPKAIANQKAVMEYLLIHHPLDCPVCDQAGECYLQDYSFRYGRSESRYEEQKIKQPTKDIGPHVKLYADRCIMCSRCVRFTKEISGTGEIGIFGRGNREQIDVFPGKPLNNELSGNVVDICPVGALLDKDFLFTQRVWNLRPAPSIDGITASGDNIWLDENMGRIYRLRPRHNMDVNKWWISDEIRYGWKFVHDERRMTTPRRQQFGTSVEADWKRAYGDAHDGLKSAAASGPGSISLMVSPMLSCEEAYVLGRMARAIDEQAVLAIGPVPTEGEDKTFPGGYTIYAEKCPNRRGVKRALELVGGSEDEIVEYDALLEKLADKKSPIQAVVLTGNYPSAWMTGDLTKAVGKKFSVLLDTLESDFAAKANIVLPSVTWAEKSGTFENISGRLQSFEQAIAPVEFAREEGQIAIDLMATFGHADPQRYDAAAVRDQMGGVFVDEVHHPAGPAAKEPDMAYVEF